jgi:hypothetical protein
LGLLDNFDMKYKKVKVSVRSAWNFLLFQLIAIIDEVIVAVCMM